MYEVKSIFSREALETATLDQRGRHIWGRAPLWGRPRRLSGVRRLAGSHTGVH